MKRRQRGQLDGIGDAFVGRFGHNEQTGRGGRERVGERVTDHRAMGLGGGDATGGFVETPQYHNHYISQADPVSARERELVSELSALKTEHAAMSKAIRELQEQREEQRHHQQQHRQQQHMYPPHQEAPRSRAQQSMLPSAAQPQRHGGDNAHTFDPNMFGNNASPSRSSEMRASVDEELMAARPYQPYNYSHQSNADPPTAETSFETGDNSPQGYGLHPHAFSSKAPKPTWEASRQNTEDPPAGLDEDDRDAIEALFGTDDFADRFNQGGEIARYGASTSQEHHLPPGPSAHQHNDDDVIYSAPSAAQNAKPQLRPTRLQGKPAPGGGVNKNGPKPRAGRGGHDGGGGASRVPFDPTKPRKRRAQPA